MIFDKNIILYIYIIYCIIYNAYDIFHQPNVDNIYVPHR